MNDIDGITWFVFWLALTAQRRLPTCFFYSNFYCFPQQRHFRSVSQMISVVIISKEETR